MDYLSNLVVLVATKALSHDTELKTAVFFLLENRNDTNYFVKLLNYVFNWIAKEEWITLKILP